MEDKKIENLIPELSDEALDQAAGGQSRYSPGRPQCSVCFAVLTTEEELKASRCAYHIANPRER